MEDVKLGKNTKVPLVWLFVLCLTLSSAILFLADIRSIARVNSVRMDTIEDDIKTMQTEIKDEIKEIRKKIDLIMSQCERN